MGNISLFVLASDVNDLNGGALTANFSHLLRDPVQITLNRPLISNWLRASHFQRCTAALRTPGNSKKITHSELHRSIGLRLTSIDRNDLYRHNATIDRESLGEFQFRRSVFLPRAMSRRLDSIRRIFLKIVNRIHDVSVTMLPNCITDAARCSCGLETDYIESGCTCSLWFHSRQSGRDDYRATKGIENACESRNLNVIEKKSRSTSPSLPPERAKRRAIPKMTSETGYLYSYPISHQIFANFEH